MAISPISGDGLLGLGGSLLGAAAGIWGANEAANAQEDAAKKAADAARRNMMLQLGLNEPNRFLGYQAQGDLASALGYQQAPYTPMSAFASTLNPIGAKGVKQALKQGMSVDQIAGMGTLGKVNSKTIKRLTRAGLSMGDIQRLQSGAAFTQNAPTPGTAPAAGGTGQNFSRFIDSPDYQFRLNEGQRDIGNSFAARGGAASGNALRALSTFNQNLAASEYGNWFARRAQLAGVGTAAQNNVGQAAQNTTGAMMGAAQATGDARASGIMGGVNSAVNSINSGINNVLLSKYLNQAPAYQPYYNANRGYAGINPMANPITPPNTTVDLQPYMPFPR